MFAKHVAGYVSETAQDENTISTEYQEKVVKI